MFCKQGTAVGMSMVIGRRNQMMQRYPDLIWGTDVGLCATVKDVFGL